MSSLVQKFMSSPLGELRLVANEEALTGVYFSSHRRMPLIEARNVSAHVILDHTERELREYFRGERRNFTVPLTVEGTDFQRAVWGALRAIPFGERRSYAELAQVVCRPRAVRAVGSANARNAISILVPCHRIVGADGELSGYAGGLPAKRWLLEHERDEKLYGIRRKTSSTRTMSEPHSSII